MAKQKKPKKGECPEHLRKHCFQPGESGNPGGRPKSKHISERLIQILEEGTADELAALLVAVAKGKRKMSQIQLGVIDRVMDRTEGAVVKKQEIGGRDGKPIQFEDCTPDENEKRLAALLQKGGLINAGSTQP